MIKSSLNFKILSKKIINQKKNMFIGCRNCFPLNGKYDTTSVSKTALTRKDILPGWKLKKMPKEPLAVQNPPEHQGKPRKRRRAEGKAATMTTMRLFKLRWIQGNSLRSGGFPEEHPSPVSYTHLTLPTIA